MNLHDFQQTGSDPRTTRRISSPCFFVPFVIFCYFQGVTSAIQNSSTYRLALNHQLLSDFTPACSPTARRMPQSGGTIGS